MIVSFRLMVVITLFFWAGFVVATVPAVWLIRVLPFTSLASGFSGTVWTGQVADLIIVQDDEHFSLGQAAWRLEPLSLLTLMPCAQIEGGQSGQILTGRICWNRNQSIELHQAKLSVPAAVLRQWLPLELTGDIELVIEHAHIAGANVLALSGSGSWTDAGVNSGATHVGLGALRVDIGTDQNGNILNHYTDTNGPLQFDLQSLLSLRGEFNTEGEILVGDGATKEMLRILPLIAEEQSSGRFQVAWSGRWK